jgi:hypothetical protein
MDKDRGAEAIVEAMTWCEMHRASVAWTDEQICRVDVLAPGSHWQTIRGSGVTLPEAYRACRAQYEAEAIRPSYRPSLVGAM